MSYQEWERYHNSRTSNNNRPTNQRPVLRPQSQNSAGQRPNISTSNRQPVRANAKRVVKNKSKTFKPTPKDALALLLVVLLSGTAIWGITSAIDDASENRSEIVNSVEDLELGKPNKPDKEYIANNNVQITEEQLLDYESYCYVGNYGSKQYLFCPEEYVLKLAEYSIDKLNKLYKNSGKMELLDNGKCIPDCITPELLAAICFTESTYRVESVKGLPLGADRDCSASNRAEGMLQQKPVFVEDANRYSLKYGGTGYDNEDRYNPLTAMEMCVTNLTRIYRAYLQPDCTTYKNLGATSSKDDKLLGALIVAYNQGEGSMQKWAKSGDLVKMLNAPNSTDNYGAKYYRAVTENLEDVLEDDYQR